MATKPQPLKGGNASIRTAINERTEALWRHGVNPAGMPGWSETADGWKPPLAFGGGERSVFPWSINAVGDGLYGVTVGTILKGDDSVSEKLTCSNVDYQFTPSADTFLVIKITKRDPATYELKLLTEWPEDDGKTVSYTGTVATTDFEFVARYYPLWHFVESSTDESAISVGENVVGVRCAPFANLVIQDSLYRTPTNEIVFVPRFGVSHTALNI